MKRIDEMKIRVNNYLLIVIRLALYILIKSFYSPHLFHFI